jgi:hypothetical protein
MTVANIVSKNKINVSEDFNVVQSMDEIIHGLPTLIVGFDYMDKHYPDFNILDRKISENLYWTFKKTERRDKHDEDLTWFMVNSYNDLIKDISYVFIDPLQYKTKVLLKILRKINEIKNIVTYVNGDMAYIYGEKYIFGVDLRLLEYVGFKKDKVKRMIKSKSSVFLDQNEILIEYKKYVEDLGLKVRYLPYLFSIKNEQNNITSNIHLPRES